MYPIRLMTAMTVSVILFSAASVSAQAGSTNSKTTSDTSSPDVLKSATYNSEAEVLNVSFRLAGAGDVHFDLVNISTRQSQFSKTVSFKETGELNYSIDMRNYPKGSYVLDFRSRQRFSGKRLIVKN